MRVVVECQMSIMLNNVGDIMPPYGTLGMNWRCIDVLFLNIVYVLLHLMKFAMNWRTVHGMLFGAVYV